MAEPRLAKNIAIGLRAVEFFFGLVAAAAIFFSAVWIEADSATIAQPMFWPLLAAVLLALVLGPPFVAFLAERAKSPRTVYVCLAILIAYPLALFGWTKLDGA